MQNTYLQKNQAACYTLESATCGFLIGYLDMDKKTALQRLQRYCAQAEHCHYEVQQKLRDWGVGRDDADEIILELIEDRFLNEGRFALAFVHDKFHLQQWGKTKIVQHLRQKRVSDNCIDEALEQIKPSHYAETIEQLARRKAAQLPNGLHYLQRKQKIVAFLLQRGFEFEQIMPLLEQI